MVLNTTPTLDTQLTSKLYVDTAVNKKQNTLTAGDNITISGNTISSTGGTNTIETNASYTNMTVTNDLNVNNLFSSTKNYGFLYRNGTQNLGNNTVAYPIYNATGLFNTALFTNNNNTEMRVLKAGYYRVNSEVSFENLTYTDRVTMRQRILKNGSFAVIQGYGFCYIRHSLYGNYGSISMSTILLLSVNDVIRQEWAANFAANQGFNTNMASRITATSQQLMLEFLG